MLSCSQYPHIKGDNSSGSRVNSKIIKAIADNASSRMLRWVLSMSKLCDWSHDILTGSEGRGRPDTL